MNKEIQVNDIHLASFLMAKDFRLRRIEGERRKTFIFVDVPPEKITEFYSDQDTVSARRLLDALRNLKGFIAQSI